MARNKPIPRSQRLLFNRGEKISRNSPGAKDDVKNLSVGIMDMDSAIMYYFNEVIKPEITVNKEKVKVPCIYASPERWFSIQKQGYLRDKKRQVIVPLIAFKRTGMSRDDNMPVDKLDANEPNLHYTFQKRYSQQNRFDKFSVLQNIAPNREYYNVAMPDYVELTYEFKVWTSYIEQMNKIVEKINYSDGAYWGEPGKMKFRTKLDSFSDSVSTEGERLITTTFNITLNGYILPESFNSQATTKKYLTPKKLIVRENTSKTLVDSEGKSLFAPGEAPGGGADAGGESFKDIFGISVGNTLTFTQGTGVTLSNSGIGFDGSAALTQAMSIGQSVATTATVEFNQVTASKLQLDSGTIYTSTGISGSLGITGSLQTSGDITVLGDATISGVLTAQEFHTTYTSGSIVFASGSTQLGDSIDDTHNFTGSLKTSGSFVLNGYSVNEISNDTTMADGSTTALVTENAAKSYVDSTAGDAQTYLRKQYVKSSASITNATTASFTAVTASAPTGYTTTNENDFIFFINGQYMEHNALAIQQKGSSLELHVHTGSIGYDLESDDEILSIGKFNS